MIEPQEGCNFVDMRWPHILVFSSPRGPFLPAPHTQYDPHEGQFDQPVTRVDGGELPWHVVPHHGANEDHENKPEPQPNSKLHRAPPVNDPKLYDKACEHISCALRSGRRGLRRSLHEYPPSHAVEVALGVQLSRQRCASRVWRHLETPRLFRSRNCWPRNREPSNRRRLTSHRPLNLCNELLLPRTILRKPSLGFTAKKSQFLGGKCFPRHHEDR
jgi:hypothetical protein